MAYCKGPKQKLTKTNDMCFSQRKLGEEQEKELPIALLRRQNTGFCVITSCNQGVRISNSLL